MVKNSIKNIFGYYNVQEENKLKLKDCIDLLEDKDKKILQKKCGMNYDGVDSTTLSNTENSRLHSYILPKLSATYESVKNLAYGSEEYKTALQEAKKKLSKTRRTAVSISNLIAYFEYLYTFEELDGVVKSLLENETKAIYAVCGPRLDGVNTEENTLDKKERSRVNTHYMPKIKSRLKKQYPNRVAPLLTDNGKNDAKDAELGGKETLLPPVPSMETKSFPLVEGIIGVSVKDEIGFTKEDYLDIATIFNSEEFKELTKLNMPLEEAIVATLIHHGYGQKRFSIKELEDFLGINRDRIVEIAKRSTETYRNAINQKITDYEMKLEKLLVESE